MLRHFALFVLLLCLCLTTIPTFAWQEPWTALTQRDLHAIHDLIRDNHSGPVDPQNPGFKDWLDTGLQQANARAEKARSFADYKRSLLFYTNGFRDGHIVTFLNVDAVRTNWPGFLVGRPSETSGDHPVRVTVVAETNPPISAGAVLLSCDGISVEDLLRTRIDPYYWNRDIPHERDLFVPRLFISDDGDEGDRLHACRFNVNGKEITQTLNWRSIDRTEASRKLRDATGLVVPDLSIRQLHGVWFVSLPTFNFPGPEQTTLIKAFIQKLAAQSPELRTAPRVVFDVRGNGGGNSDFGWEIARAFWGHELVDKITDSFDSSADWRASPANLQHLADAVASMKEAGLPEVAAYRETARQGLETALKEGKPYYQQVLKPSASSGPLPTNPVKAQVYFLTDGRCASACLDFADILLRIPGVVHIGLPTSADAVYIDNTIAPLPSALADLSYSLKVYRHRTRGNNVWYTPAIRWPGGPMHDDALAAWISQLNP